MYKTETETEILLNHAFTLFECLEDAAETGVIEAVEYFITEHNFQVAFLPESLRDHFKKQSAEDNKLDHDIDRAEDFANDDLY